MIHFVRSCLYVLDCQDHIEARINTSVNNLLLVLLQIIGMEMEKLRNLLRFMSDLFCRMISKYILLAVQKKLTQ